MDAPVFFVYIVECADNTLYTGSTNNLTKRIREHNAAKAGARYTRGRRPVRLAYAEAAATLSDALAREAQIKKLSRTQKLLLIQASSGSSPRET